MAKSSLIYLRNQEHQNNGILLTNNPKTLLAEKLVIIPQDGVVHAQNKCEIRKYFTYWEGDIKKCNGHHNNFQKR